MKASYVLALTAFLSQPLFVSADEVSYCVELTAPVTSVADLDANGIVNSKDIALLAKYLGKGKKSHTKHHNKSKRFHSEKHRKHEKTELVYSPLYDRNADGDIDNIDIYLATRDMGKSSTQEDQELAKINNEILAGTYTCVVQPEVPAAPAPAPTVPDTTPTADAIIYI